MCAFHVSSTVYCYPKLFNKTFAPRYHVGHKVQIQECTTQCPQGLLYIYYLVLNAGRGPTQQSVRQVQSKKYKTAGQRYDRRQAKIKSGSSKTDYTMIIHWELQKDRRNARTNGTRRSGKELRENRMWTQHTRGRRGGGWAHLAQEKHIRAGTGNHTRGKGRHQT